MQTETSTSTFLDDLLAETEVKEGQQTAAFFDLVIMDIANLESQIAANFMECDKEVELIKDWTLKRNSALKERSSLLRLRLEFYIRAENKKTIELPRGTLKIRKMPDKVEITDIEIFLANANAQMINVVPESVKPDLTKIRNYLKLTGGKPIAGVTVIEGVDRFSLTLRNTTSTEETE